MATASLKNALASQKAANALLAVLHDYVEIVVGDEILYYSDRALLRFAKILQRHGPFYLHHDALLEVAATLPEVLELLDEEQGLREFILGNICFDRRQELLNRVGLQLWFIISSICV